MQTEKDLFPLSRRSLLAGMAASSALVMLHPFAVKAAANQAHLRLMETTDIHVNVMPYDYYADAPNDTLVWETVVEILDDPWEFDPGPPKNRSWARLFAETPNYRAIGLAMSGSEEFRWHFGPMFYRGRLRDNSVKVLVIGQEGAQDESLSHRSFTGGTGARMQHFLHHMGITESYLFLNTFVYPIFGQYNGLLPRLAQDQRSPIARHRGRLLDYVVVRNDLRLVVAVGRAAKESVATWIESHGGHADADRDADGGIHADLYADRD